MESICRLCCNVHKNSRVNNLFDVKHSRLLAKLNYFACFTFKLNVNDGFPPYICHRCSGLLEVAYEFKLICESAEANYWAMSQSIVKDEMEKECSSPQIQWIELTDDQGDNSLERLEVSE